jgi:N-methylhydantoinase A/oxoprolinase/acetone carboxylase beta subunit
VSATQKIAQIGVDVGGTFTDFIFLDEEGRVRIGKRLTSGHDPSEAVVAGTEEMLEGKLGRLKRLVHGTTVATNTILTRSGARVGMLVTRGFRDTLDIMDKIKYDIYDLNIEFPEPLIPRRLRREVTERVTRDGAVRAAPDPAEVRAAVAELLAEGAEAITVCFLHAYRFPAHEQQVAAQIRAEHPDLLVGTSAEICPDIGEFLRFSTATINMYIRPRMQRYLDQLEGTLRRRSLGGGCYMMLSTGGTADFGNAGTLPIRLIESGPAAGALAAAYYGRLGGMDQLIAFDMGGTTAKACVVDGGKPSINYDHFEVARVHRFKKGSGIPLKAPSIDMIEIGAGGGSIARVDALGFLKVGPDSAESNPGPACYGLGGTQPTVTDANLMLGYLDGGYFLGGKMRLDRDRAVGAVTALAMEGGMEPLRAAWGIHEVVSESMAAAARTHLLEKGRDARKYALFAFGGSGPVHACRVAHNLGIRKVICALGAGTLSALGLLLAPLAFDFAHSDVAPLAELDTAPVNAFFAEAEAEGRRRLTEAGIEPASVEVARFAALRYSGQGYEVAVPLPNGPITAGSRATVEALFLAEYERLYGRTDPDNVVETVSWRLVASGPPANIQLDRSLGDVALGGGAALKGERQVYFPETLSHVATPVYDRYALSSGDTVQGPAIVEERESTVVVMPGWTANVDALHSLILEKTA